MPLPTGHRFPMGKYPALRSILEREGLLRPTDLIEPHEAHWDDIRLVHTPEYAERLLRGELDRGALRRLGLPWSEALLTRARLAAQGTINAALACLNDGIAANLAGGTHHAFPDRGEGFCVLNDVVIAIRVLQRAHRVQRAIIVDLDVHQGNGTAACTARDEGVFSFSMHGARNYPFFKVPSTLDVGLPDAAGDADYLEQLSLHLPALLRRATPQIAFYLAGVDVVAGDRFGRLALTRAGLHARDAYVLETLRRAAIPTCLVLSGGYAATAEQTADLHAVVHREARRVFG